MEEQKIAIKEKTMPEHLKKYGPLGAEDIIPDEIRLEYIKLGQFSSYAVIDRFVEMGQFYTSMDNEELGDTIEIIPIRKTVVWKKFEKNKLAATSEDGKYWATGQEYSGKRLTEEESFRCKRIQFIVRVVGKSTPYILSFSGNSFKAGKTLADLVDKKILSNKEPIFSSAYKLKPRKESANKNTYYVITIAGTRYTTEEESKQANETYQLVSQTKIKEEDVPERDDIYEEIPDLE